MLEDDRSTTIPYDKSYRLCVESWVASGNYIANHTHSHAAVYEVPMDELKADILRADQELSPYIKKAPSKVF